MRETINLQMEIMATFTYANTSFKVSLQSKQIRKTANIIGYLLSIAAYRVNSHNDFVIMTATQTLSCVLVLVISIIINFR